MASDDILKQAVSAKTLGKVLGVSDRRIMQMADDGVLEKVGRGRYDLAKCVQAYISFKTKETKLEKESIVDGYEMEKIKLTRAKRLMEEKKLQIIVGDLHRSQTVKAVMNRMLANFKGKIQALPVKLAPRLIGETSVMVIQDKMQEAVGECLTELSEYDPSLFYDESDDIIVTEDVEFDEDGNMVGGTSG